MYRRYTTRYNDTEALTPRFSQPIPQSQPRRDSASASANITHTKAKEEDSEILHLRETPHKGGLLSGLNLGGITGGLFDGSLFKDGGILGKFKFDDILLAFMIFMLLQDKENQDIPLILALGYVFIGDKLL